MKILARNGPIAIGLAGMLALAAVTAASAQYQEDTERGNGHLSQYCAPKDEESPDARKLYC
jgi:hypothetical protein